MRRVALAGLVVAALAAVSVWRCRGGDPAAPPAPAAAPAPIAPPRSDPRTLPRASLAGTVRDEAGVAVAGARVCASARSRTLPTAAIRDARCATSDAGGAYRIDALVPMTYAVAAMAKGFQPARHKPDVAVAAGQALAGIDLVVEHGGAQVTGVVSDITGGPIAHALVANRFEHDSYQDTPSGVAVETDDQGKYALWVKPGRARIQASADGYAPNDDSVRAPGTLDIVLTPESTLAGTVVDAATGAPIEGARVAVAPASSGADRLDITDAEGHFRVSRLGPDRYVVTARTPHGYGMSEGSTLVPLSAHVDGVVVRVFPALRVEGKVMAGDTPCAEPEVDITDERAVRWLPLERDGDTLHADGVPPGTYRPEVTCRGQLSRDKYDPIVLVDRDATGLVWQVAPGAAIRGRVLTSTGEPVAGARVWARTIGGDARAKLGWGSDESARDGSYALAGLRPGTYAVQYVSDRGVAPEAGIKVELAATATVERDLVLETGGTVRGTVVDGDGRGVAKVTVALRGNDRGDNSTQTDDSGNFVLEGIRPGDYQATPQATWWRPLRKPGTTDDARQGERVSVRAGQTATVHLVVEAQSATITGSVVDGGGSPVGDAFVVAARESDAAGATASAVADTRWRWDDRPVVTGTDGSFALGHLAPGHYTVRAYRKGGGEAVADHVAAGTTTRLQIKPTASIAGTVQRAGGGPPLEYFVTLNDPIRSFERTEHVYRTDGRFAIRDLPAGHYQLTATASGGRHAIELDLAEAEARTGITIELDPLVTLTGKVVDAITHEPLPAIRMLALPIVSGGGWSFSNNERDNISDATGSFTITDVPRGEVAIRAWPKDGFASDYASLTSRRTIGPGAPSPFDLGEIALFKRRVPDGKPVGELGLHFADSPTPFRTEYKVSWIDPQGPAAKTEIKVGDVLASIDGYDITGVNAGNASTLMRASPGTRLALGLARGVTVTITLAAP